MAKTPTVKPWIIEPDDRAYIIVRELRLAEAEKTARHLRKQIADREHAVWDNRGGRERFLAGQRQGGDRNG